MSALYVLTGNGVVTDEIADATPTDVLAWLRDHGADEIDSLKSEFRIFDEVRDMPVQFAPGRYVVWLTHEHGEGYESECG
jgi:hypothetical protein